MGLRPTHRDESALLRFIDSKQVTRDFRRSAIEILRQLTANSIQEAAITTACQCVSL
jgi:hypothetical protein